MSYWFKNDHKLPQERLTITSYLIVGIIGLLLLGFWKLQVNDSDRYSQLAERNRIRTVPIIAPRGRMLDREGRVLVDNYPSFSVLLLRDSQQLVEKSLPQIAEGLNIPIEDLRQQIDAMKSLPRFQPIVIKPEATPADIAFIESHRADIPVIEMVMVHRRRYMRDGFMAHLSGYVGEVSPDEVDASDGRYRPGDVVGKSGLEKQYNDILVGTDGQRRTIVNSLGKEMGRLEEVEATPGKLIQLTIDYDLQAVAEAGLEGKEGAVVALNPQNGEVLAMASQPSPDPNSFAVRIPKEEWKRLNEDDDKPLLNRAIQAQLAPGSTFKAVMATAMLESKAIPEDFTAFCPGYAYFYGRKFDCHIISKGHGHGTMDLHNAIMQSCDVFFYNLGQRLGIDRISYYAYKLGLGRKTGIDLPSEESGLMPSDEWKQRVFHQKWYPGETISVAIGQGAVMATPVQMAHLYGGIMMGGVFKQPHLLLGATNLAEDRFPISDSTVEKLTEAFFGVVNEGGTAANVKLPGIEFCGKTGTSQVISAKGKARAASSAEFKNNAWFVGYAPRHNPEIVVAVLVQEGGHGNLAAAPIARDIVKAYYDKKTRRLQNQLAADNKQPVTGGQPGVVLASPDTMPAKREH